MAEAILMKPWKARRLTDGEHLLVIEVFGEGVIDTRRTRIWSLPPCAWTTKRPFTPGGLIWPGRSVIVFPPKEALTDFSDPAAPLSATATFVHEMVHVAQSQGGTNLLWAKIKAGDSPEAYRYTLSPLSVWDAFNIEQQAMIVEDDFIRTRGRKPPYDQAHYARIIPFKKPPATDGQAGGR